jgi:hypothetical protein
MTAKLIEVAVHLAPFTRNQSSRARLGEPTRQLQPQIQWTQGEQFETIEPSFWDVLGKPF